MRNLIYSTISTDVAYAYWQPGGQGTMVQNTERTVLVKGGAGVANDRIITPEGVVTEVTDDQLEHLLQDLVFQLHVDGGFIKVVQVATAPSVEQVVADMTGRDESAPLVPQDFPSEPTEKATAAPVTGKRGRV